MQNSPSTFRYALPEILIFEFPPPPLGPQIQRDPPRDQQEQEKKPVSVQKIHDVTLLDFKNFCLFMDETVLRSDMLPNVARFSDPAG